LSIIFIFNLSYNENDGKYNAKNTIHQNECDWK
jgi:hypothetical protein